MNIVRSRSESRGLIALLGKTRIQRGTAWGIMIVGALLAFEIFNYSTTEFALNDVLGNLRFLGIRWATILAIAFCGIDFAGIARLFTPEQGADEPAEVWYLFGAWLLAAAMNAMLTWWGVSIAITNHQSLGSAVVSSTTLTKVVPIFVALMVWLIRVLIIGTFSIAGERLFSQADQPVHRSVTPTTARASRPASLSVNKPVSTPTFRPAPKSVSQSEAAYSRPEPTYHNLSFGARSNPQTIGERASYEASSHPQER